MKKQKPRKPTTEVTGFLGFIHKIGPRWVATIGGLFLEIGLMLASQKNLFYTIKKSL